MPIKPSILTLTAALALSGCASGSINPFGSSEPNAGACPAVLALRDAARYVEFRAPDEVYSNVGYTAEIYGIDTFCRYYYQRPIVTNVKIGMGFGRGPAAEERSHTYRYWIAVTRRDLAVIHKEWFEVTADFSDGNNSIFRTVEIPEVIIPRVNEDVSGANFEILVGFELTEAQIEFNREGKRFRVDAGQGEAD